MKLTIGVFAHVDAGKTTFCECLLYQTKKIETFGRVDHGSALMDYNELERRRGITIFSDIASFLYGSREYYLIDTPGHIDFSAEMERSLSVLDAAILLISAADGVQSHTITLCKLLKEKKIPIYVFINKTDQTGANVQRCLNDIEAKLHLNCYLVTSADELTGEDFIELLCEYDDELMNFYLEGKVDNDFERKVIECTKRQIMLGNIVLAAAGSALKQTGIIEILNILEATAPEIESLGDKFSGRIFKVVHDSKGARVAFLKCLAGSLKIRDEIHYGNEMCEKINEIRDYQGESYTNLNAAYVGDIVGVTGLNSAVPGMGLGNCLDMPVPVLNPALKAAVIIGGSPFDAVMSCLRKLEAQDPLLEVFYEPSIKEISVRIMGKIQLEVLKELILAKFGLNVDFGECQVLYRETIAEPIKGYGHFEPLRHYAEVHLRMEPNPGGGFEFKSELHTDRLAKQYQNLIRHHVLDRDHKGILTGSSLTDIRFVLTDGAVHVQYTDGGDLRESAYRAVRQGLEKAKSVLLEPYYEFYIDVDTTSIGRVLSDIARLYGIFDPPETIGDRSYVKGKGPVASFIDYQAELLSFTKGTGVISLNLLGYFPCHNSETIIEKIGYEKERDMENTSSSVFCTKGAGFEVKWFDAESKMHLPL
ncbi:MAG: TetM/TetW/TetO/TetS family tetracycline resistance ribosomal protection protein [Defluviitaleaceae bacterium]|nr:TetM/TetW/TetO/TetS family tetracycline resistance ribosomal protection protein [Defluviitaleaceae bacterium]